MKYYINININYEPYTFQLSNISKEIIKEIDEYLGHVESVIYGESFYSDGMIRDVSELIEQLHDEDGYSKYQYSEYIQNIISWLTVNN